MPPFMVPLLAGALLGGGGGTSSSSTSSSINTLIFNPTNNVGGDIRGQVADGRTDANVTSAAVSDNTPDSALNSSLLQPQGSASYGDLSAGDFGNDGMSIWVWVGGGAAILAVGYFATRGGAS